MDDRRLHLSPTARREAELLGEDGRRWLDELPALVADLERTWAVDVIEAVPEATEAYVARVRRADGRQAVLKVSVPMPWPVARNAVIELAEGRGYVRPLASDPARGALLMEALGPSLADTGWPVERQMTVLCAILREAWEAPLPDERPMNGAERAAELAESAEQLWSDLERPCPRNVIDAVLRMADRRAAAHSADSARLTHGDPHAGNALRVPEPRPGAESGFVFIDPVGILAEPAYDLGAILRDWDDELAAGDARAVARRYCGLLADETGVDADAIWEWGLMERAVTGMWGMERGIEWGRKKLEVASRLL